MRLPIFDSAAEKIILKLEITIIFKLLSQVALLSTFCVCVGKSNIII